MGRGSDEVLRHLLGLRETLYRLFDEQQFAPGGEGDAVAPWAPPMDIYETPESFVLVAELPGMDREGIHVETVEDLLLVRGERPLHRKDPAVSYHRVERPNGTFQRAFRLPAGVASGSVTATYRSGVLRVVLPKGESRSIGVVVE